MDEEYSIELYKADNGKSPYLEWESKLDIKVCTQVMSRISRVRLGNFGDCKPIENGVWELKVDKGPGYRIYYGIKGKKIVILLCAGDKKSQKRDVKKALKYWSECNEKNCKI